MTTGSISPGACRGSESGSTLRLPASGSRRRAGAGRRPCRAFPRRRRRPTRPAGARSRRLPLLVEPHDAGARRSSSRHPCPLGASRLRLRPAARRSAPFRLAEAPDILRELMERLDIGRAGLPAPARRTGVRRPRGADAGTGPPALPLRRRSGPPAPACSATRRWPCGRSSGCRSPPRSRWPPTSSSALAAGTAARRW